MNSVHNDKAWFEQCLTNKQLLKKIKSLKMVVFDIDGTLTDGTMAYDNDGEAFRFFSITDGFSIVSAQQAGLQACLLSGKAHGSVEKRSKKLQIPEKFTFGGKTDKLTIIKQIAKQESLKLENMLLFGDDYYDAKVKLEAPELMYATPQDAPFYFHHSADLVVPRDGGKHAARLLLDLILYVQDKHFAQTSINQALNER